MTTTVIKTIVTVLYIVICVALVIVVLMQEVSGAADSYWTRNKGRSSEGVLIKLTRILAILFVLLSLLLCTDWLG